jgi:hypothetical protein
MLRLILCLALSLSCALSNQARAEGSRSTMSVPNATGYLVDTSIGTGASAEAVDFTDCAFIVCVENDSSTVSVLVQLVKCGGTVTAENLATPTNGALSTVQVISPVTALKPVVCFPGWWQGIKWEGLTSAGTATVRIVQ